MNYAEDRLDRRARHDDGLLWKDYCLAFSEGDHSLLAKTLRDAGWNRHALYHFGEAWIRQPDNWVAASDYAQMAELAGFPGLACIALWLYRTKGKLSEQIKESNAFILNKGPSWLDQQEPNGGCGCGSLSCGEAKVFLPFEKEELDRVLHRMETCLRQVEEAHFSRDMPFASEVLQHLSTFKRETCLASILIPPELNFWHQSQCEDLKAFRELPPACQALFIKLLFLTLPSLAASLVAHANYNKKTVTLMQTDFKSHWAYFVLIKAALFGPECVKRSKRFTNQYYHVPVWDLLWNLDWRRDYSYEMDSSDVHEDGACHQGCDDFFQQLRLSILSSSRPNGNKSTATTPLRLWRLPDSQYLSPLVFVGDSHILSLAWQVIQIKSSLRRAVPFLVTGLKAWHIRHETRFFTQTCWQAALWELRHSPSRIRTIVLSAGEIDCREGLGQSLSQGYTYSAEEEIERIHNTVGQYVSSIAREAKLRQLQVLVMPVPPHLYSSKGRIESRRARRLTTQRWNAELRKMLPMDDSVFFLDYESALVDTAANGESADDSYVLKPALNADSTHMNAAFCRHFEAALHCCGCNLENI